MGFSYSQDHRHRTIAGAAHRPRFRATDGLGPVCDERPVPLAVEPIKPPAPVTDDQLLAMAPEDLVSLRDRISAMVRARDREPRAVPPVMRQIVRIAADEGGITVAELLSAGRRASYAKPRQRAMASISVLIKDDGSRRFSPGQIGYYFRRDRTTVNHAVAVVPAERLIQL